MRELYPWIRIKYSNRTHQDGYFLLILPDGTVATQYTDHRDKVRLGHVFEMGIDDLRQHALFKMDSHGRKWVSAAVSVDPACIYE